MPGSPPTSTAEAATSPPPSTRSSSSIAVRRRGGGSTVPVSPSRTRRVAARADLAGRPGRASAGSSAIVFHSPQVSQRPAHLEVTAPQDWQTKRGVGLAIGFPPRTRIEGDAPWGDRRMRRLVPPSPQTLPSFCCLMCRGQGAARPEIGDAGGGFGFEARF